MWEDVTLTEAFGPGAWNNPMSPDCQLGGGISDPFGLGGPSLPGDPMTDPMGSPLYHPTLSDPLSLPGLSAPDPMMSPGSDPMLGQTMSPGLSSFGPDPLQPGLGPPALSPGPDLSMPGSMGSPVPEPTLISPQQEFSYTTTYDPEEARAFMDGPGLIEPRFETQKITYNIETGNLPDGVELVTADDLVDGLEDWYTPDIPEQNEPDPDPKPEQADYGPPPRFSKPFKDESWGRNYGLPLHRGVSAENYAKWLKGKTVGPYCYHVRDPLNEHIRRNSFGTSPRRGGGTGLLKNPRAIDDRGMIKRALKRFETYCAECDSRLVKTSQGKYCPHCGLGRKEVLGRKSKRTRCPRCGASVKNRDDTSHCSKCGWTGPSSF